MSRYILTPYNPAYEITVGWDAPMRTFFAQVHDTKKPLDEEDLILWIGKSYDEVKKVDIIVEALKEYAGISGSVIEQLKNDMQVAHTQSEPQMIAEELFNFVKENSAVSSGRKE